MTTPARRFMRSPAAGYIALVIVLFTGGMVTQHNDSKATRDAQIAGCERGKLDRVDHARVYMAQALYWQGVLDAKSVQEDVKRIARNVHQAVEESALGMKSRILKCEPLIDDGRQVPDTDLLRQLPASPAE